MFYWVDLIWFTVWKFDWLIDLNLIWFDFINHVNKSKQIHCKCLHHWTISLSLDQTIESKVTKYDQLFDFVKFCLGSPSHKKNEIPYVVFIYMNSWTRKCYGYVRSMQHVLHHTDGIINISVMFLTCVFVNDVGNFNFIIDKS